MDGPICMIFNMSKMEKHLERHSIIKVHDYVPNTNGHKIWGISYLK